MLLALINMFLKFGSEIGPKDLLYPGQVGLFAFFFLLSMTSLVLESGVVWSVVTVEIPPSPIIAIYLVKMSRCWT